MKKIAIGLLSVAIALLVIGIVVPIKGPADVSASERLAVGYKKLYSLRFEHSYREINRPVRIEHLTLPGQVTRFGVEGYVAKFIRALRFKPLTDAVEDRYNLPAGILFSMMVEESNGVEFLPNGLGDGGFGLCHMQPSNAKLFSLKTYRNCSALKCNGTSPRSCLKDGKRQNHAKELLAFLTEHRFDRKLLADSDERLHHLKNIDAAGRMLAAFMSGPPLANMGPLRTAICRYAGSYNYVAYWRDVKTVMNLLTDTAFLKKVEETFNALNGKLEIDGKKGNWELYIRSFHKLCENYGLEAYKQLPKYEPKNSQLVKETYKKFL